MAGEGYAWLLAGARASVRVPGHPKALHGVGVPDDLCRSWIAQDGLSREKWSAAKRKKGPGPKRISIREGPGLLQQRSGSSLIGA
jgi:hypothetical protein